jgi:ribonuclease HI
MTDLSDTITAAMSGQHITIHSDGAAKGNPGPGGWGAVLCRMEGTSELKRLLRKGFDPSHATTNITMEMTAVAAALEVIKPGEPQPIIIRPDLKLIVQGMTEWLPGWIARGWRKGDGKPVENRSLWERLIAATEGKTVYWLHVKGHAGDERNELAHKIAGEQMRKAMQTIFDAAA